MLQRELPHLFLFVRAYILVLPIINVFLNKYIIFHSEVHNVIHKCTKMSTRIVTCGNMPKATGHH